MSSDRFFVHHLKDGNIFELWRIRANNAGLLTTEFFHASPNAEWLDDHRSTDWKKTRALNPWVESIDTRRSVGNHERDEEVTVEDAQLVEFDMMKQATHSKKAGFGPAEAYRLSELAVTGDDAALMQLKAAAMPRDRLAQYQLGLLYELGRAVPQCASVAAEWFRMSAQLGWPYASLSLADLYTSGVGVPQDQIAALWWCLGGAMHGYEDAEYRVGLMYARGQGSPQDLDAARLWLERASLKGYERAQQALKDLSAMRRSH